MPVPTVLRVDGATRLMDSAGCERHPIGGAGDDPAMERLHRPGETPGVVGSINSTASQSSSSGCVGAAPLRPKSWVVATSGVPKCQRQMWLTATRAVSGLARSVIQRARAARRPVLLRRIDGAERRVFVRGLVERNREPPTRALRDAVSALPRPCVSRAGVLRGGQGPFGPRQLDGHSIDRRLSFGSSGRAAVFRRRPLLTGRIERRRRRSEPRVPRVRSRRNPAATHRRVGSAGRDQPRPGPSGIPVGWERLVGNARTPISGSSKRAARRGPTSPRRQHNA